MDRFSTARYLGNKSKQIQAIKKCLVDYGVLNIESMIDLFSGTGCISNMILNELPNIKEIYANDIEPYAYIYTKARLTCKESPEKVQKRLTKTWHDVEMLICASKYFSKAVTNAYALDTSRPALFTVKHSLCIDAYSHILHKPKLGQIDAPVMAAVLDEVIRKNFGYGHFHNAIRRDDKRRFAWTQTDFLPTPIHPMGHIHDRSKKDCPTIKISSQDASIALKTIYKSRHGHAVDMVFLDPPYTLDHYGRMYHVLNTIVLHDEPSTYGLHAVRSDYHRSPYSQKTKAYHSFSELFALCARFSRFVGMTYCTRGVVSVSDIQDLLMKHGFVNSKIYTIDKRNSMRKSEMTEIFILSKNKRVL